jgi:hypothetical protein
VGIKALQKIQFGRETTAGTAVAATIMWRGEGKLADKRVLKLVPEDIGQIFPDNNVYIPKLEAEISIDKTPATFEHLPHILEMGIKAATVTTVDSGSGYTWIYGFSNTAAPGTIKSYTFELGDDQDAADVEYCFAESIDLDFSPGEAVMLSAKLKGRQTTDSAFTALTPVSCEEILAGKAVLSLDASGGTIGSTPVTQAILGASVKIDTGLRALYSADGALYFSKPIFAQPKISGKFLMEHNSVCVTEVEAAESKLPRLLRIKVLGSALTTPSTYTHKTLIFDCAIRYTAVPDLSDKDGNTTVDFPWEAVYDSTTVPQVIVVNNASTL